MFSFDISNKKKKFLPWMNPFKNMLRTYKDFGKKEKERCFHFKAGEEFPEISRLF